MTVILDWLRHHWRLVRIGTMTGDQAFVEVMTRPCRCAPCRAGCRECQHAEHEHSGDLHGVGYCRACMRNATMPLMAICRGFVGAA